MKDFDYRIFYPHLFCLALFFPFVFIERGNMVIFLNGLQNPLLDQFFILASSIGNGFTMAIVAFCLLFFKIRWLYTFVIALLIQLAIVLLFKQLFFHNLFRPYMYFKQLDTLFLVDFIEGVKIRYVNSFPSGHTACVFFIVTFFMLMIRKPMVSYLLLAIGIIVGVSRIYLVQHFFIDVYFGIIFGSLSSLLAYVIVQKYPKSWFDYKIKLQRVFRSSEKRRRALSNN